MILDGRQDEMYTEVEWGVGGDSNTETQLLLPLVSRSSCGEAESRAPGWLYHQRLASTSANVPRFGCGEGTPGER